MSSKIEVIGLGGGDINQLPLGIYRKLQKVEGPVMVRTMDHPVIRDLEREGILFQSFDYIYEQTDQFQDVYESIVAILMHKAMESDVLYAVPGHPMLAEKTVQLLLASEEGDVSIIGGQSYLDDLFTTLGIDPIDGFQFVDGTQFSRSQLDYHHHLIFCQVYDRFIASDVKLALLEDLPPDYQVMVLDAVGTSQEKVMTVPLAELDYKLEVSNLTSIYIPPVPNELLRHTFGQLRDVIAVLRGENGCPWDKKQTHESLRKYVIEEAYELLDAIDGEDDEGIIEELGDILLQVMLHSQIGADNGYFTVDDVIRSITNKMIYRHPHVFGDDKAVTVDDVYEKWDKLKQKEKGATRPSILDGISKGLPALQKAEQLQKKASKAGVDLTDSEDPLSILNQSLQHLQMTDVSDCTTLPDLVGYCLFQLVQFARMNHVSSEVTLNKMNSRFQAAFLRMEQLVKEKGENVQSLTQQEVTAIWNETNKGGWEDAIR